MIAMRLIVVLLLLSAAPAVTSEPGDGSQPAWWVDRAERLVPTLPKGNQQTAAWMAVAAFRGRQGDIDAAQAAARQISDPADRTECLRYVTIRIARAGEFSLARQFADTIDDAGARASGLAWIARIQAERRLFDASRETLRLIELPDQLAWARHQLAYAEAAAGHYTDAYADAERIEPAGPEDQLLKDDLLAWIAEAEASGERQTPRSAVDTPPAQARHLLGPLGYQGLTGRDLERLERQARRTVDPMKMTTAWRQVAWIRLTEGDVQAARTILGQAESHLDAVNSLDERILQAAAVADLYLEAGDAKSARRVVDKHLDGGRPAKLSPYLDKYSAAALIVGVVARTVGPREAAALVRTNGSACQAAWWAAGAFGGWLQTPGAIRELLADPVAPQSRFALCMGTAQGLAARSGIGPGPASLQTP